MATHMVPYKQASGVTGVADFTSAVNPFQEFYGVKNNYSDEIFNAEAARRHRAYDLPEAYKGKNEYIPSIILQLVSDKGTWYALASPFQYTDQLYFENTTIIFDDHLPSLTPHKAPSRIVTSRKEHLQGALVRRGIAFMMEHDYMGTPEGREHYAWILNQMANAILSQHKIDTINAILEAGDFADNWQKRYGITSSQNIMDQLEIEKRFWAILQRKRRASHELDTMVSAWMKEANANMSKMAWIMHPTAMAWLELVPKENNDYWIGGPKAPRDIADSAIPTRTLAGHPVYSAEVTDTDEFRNGNPLERQREIGSYYTMVQSDRHSAVGEGELYRSGHRTIKVYDEDIDDWGYITLDVAIEHCGLFDKDGNIVRPDNRNIWSNDSGDQGGVQDFLTYQDPETGKIEDVSLFGHIAPEHASARSVMDVCHGLLDHVSEMNEHKKSEMKIVSNKAMQLYKEMREAPIIEDWFINVLIENVMESTSMSPIELVGLELISDGALDGDKWEDFLHNVLHLENNERMSIPLNVFSTLSKGALSLPKHNYIGAARDSIAQARRLNISDPEEVVNLFETSMKDSKHLGGYTRGVLAGYASWDGFLALHNEYKMAASTNGAITLNGYSLESCKIADNFVKLVKDIVNQSRIVLGDNSPYFDENIVSSHVQHATPEHAIAEWLLGMSGLPVWLDMAAVLQFSDPMYQLKKTTPPFSDSSVAAFGLNSPFEILYDEDAAIFNKFQSTALAILKKAHANDSTWDAEEAKIRSYFTLLFGWNIDASGTEHADNVTANIKNMVSKLGLPLYTGPQTKNVVLFQDALNIMDLLLEILTVWKQGDQKSKKFTDALEWALGEIYNNPLDRTLYGKVSTFIGNSQSASDLWKTDGQFSYNTFASYVFNNLLPNTKNVEGKFKTLVKKHVDKTDHIKNSMARETDNYDYNIRVGNVDRTSTRNAPIASRLLSENETDNYRDDQRREFAKSLREKQRFFRSNLVFSADQLKALYNLNMKYRGQESLKRTIEFRVSDPNDYEKVLSSQGLVSLVDRIDNLNKYGTSGNSHHDPYAPSYMILTKNLGSGNVASLALINRLKKMEKSHPSQHDGYSGRSTAYGGSNRSKSVLDLEDSDDDGDDIFSSRMVGSRSSTSRRFERPNETRASKMKEMVGMSRHLSTKYSKFNALVIRMMIILLEEDSSPLNTILYGLYLSSEINKKTLQRFIKYNVPIPLGFLVFQPHRKYTMAMGIKMRFDKDTCITFVGHENMQLMDDGKIKVHWGHWTYYSRSVTLNPRNMFHCYDIFCLAALGGSGLIPIRVDEYDIREGKTGGKGSIIFAAIPYEQRKFPNVIDIKGSFTYAGTAIDPSNLSHKHYESWNRYSQLYGWSGSSGAGTQSILNLTDYGVTDGFVNTVVFQGQQFNYNRATNDLTDKITNKGHFGEKGIGPGAKKARNGQFEDFMRHGGDVIEIQ